MTAVITRPIMAFAGALLAAAVATGQATSPSLDVKAIAEVEVKTVEGDREVTRLAPADRVVPGDQVFYTLEVRNPGNVAIAAPVVVYAIPAHMVYVADSAAGPGAEVTYSINFARTFDRPEYLRAAGADGMASPSTYTHIRWKFKHSLKPKSVALARFRAQVK